MQAKVDTKPKILEGGAVLITELPTKLLYQPAYTIESLTKDIYLIYMSRNPAKLYEARLGSTLSLAFSTWHLGNFIKSRPYTEGRGTTPARWAEPGQTT